MIIPVRCYTCGFVVAAKWKDYCQMLKEGKTPEEAFEALGVGRYCCRRMLCTHVDIL